MNFYQNVYISYVYIYYNIATPFFLANVHATSTLFSDIFSSNQKENYKTRYTHTAQF